MIEYKRAAGVLPWKEGDELPEDTIRRLRDETEWPEIEIDMGDLIEYTDLKVTLIGGSKYKLRLALAAIFIKLAVIVGGFGGVEFVADPTEEDE